MIAFVDESIKRGFFSVGVYISRGNDRVLRNFLVRTYSDILRGYGLDDYHGELKFNRFLMFIKKRVGHVDSYIINSLFDKFVEFIVGNGYARAVVTDNTSKICSIERSLCNFLLGLGIRKASIIKFLLIYFVIKHLKISKIILDSGFQISLRDARRILRVLGWKIDIAYSSSTGTPGLEIADFVAGIAPYVERRNVVAYIVSNVSAIRLL